MLYALCGLIGFVLGIAFTVYIAYAFDDFDHDKHTIED